MLKIIHSNAAIMCLCGTNLKKAGWKTKRIRGSHHQMTHTDFRHSITVPHPKKELGKGLVNAILKQAGLKE